MGQTFKKRRIKYMGNRIVISESQYSRLFLNEFGALSIETQVKLERLFPEGGIQYKTRSQK